MSFHGHGKTRSVARTARRCSIVVLITGASGFIGRRIAHAVAARGYEVLCVLRNPGAHRELGLPGRAIAGDFTSDIATADWRPRLAGVGVVVNAVGILREAGNQRFETLHVAGPRALFQACADAGVRRVVQISGLGADAEATSGYHLSKRAADEFLLRLPVSSVIVQPSLVFGAGGASARLFTLLASLPVIPLPHGGHQQVQPLHVDDAVRAVVALVESDAFAGERVPLVGPAALSLRDFLGALRQALGLGMARFLAVPARLVRAGARAGDFFRGGLLDSETLGMLERGNTGAPQAITQLLGAPPRPPAAFIGPAEREGMRALALLAWLLPLLRWSIALVWIWTAIVSFGVYPVEESYALLGRVGVERSWAPLMLYGAALSDLVLGIGTLVLRRRSWLWLAQIVLILGYSLLITVHLPEFWLHPYGPMVKNLPMLAALCLLLAFERR